MSQIGIKLANHDFFPIIDEEGKTPIEKELELTTVRDNQESVQINLFKSDGEFEPLYIGSLIIEDLNKMSCGNATIFLKLRLDENKNLHAEAVDEDSGNKQSLTVPINDLGQFSSKDFGDFGDFDVSSDVDSLNVSNFDQPFSDEDGSLAEDNKTEDAETEFSSQSDDDFLFSDVGIADTEDASDFSSINGGENLSFDSTNAQEDDVPSIADDIALKDDEDFQDANEYEMRDDYEQKGSSFPTWLKIFLIVVLLGILALVVALFLKNKMKTPKNIENIDVIEEDVLSKVEDTSIEPLEELSIDELTTEVPKKEAEPFPTKEESLPKEEVKPSDNEEVKIVRDDSIKKAVRYRIRWGDTLWDISGNFYKNPWNYKKIARYNKIKNPNKIIAGTYITVPAK